MTYGVVAAVIMVIIVAVALVVAPPAPPSIAEFAPQATETIEDSPDNQSSRFGEGDGACSEGQVCTGTTTTTVAEDGKGGRGNQRNDDRIDVNRVRRCIGEPPRQTDDPQSPPCVNYFEGDNGGATARGVTRDEIRVAVPSFGVNEDTEFRYYEYLLHHFNTRYELYGRKLTLVHVESADGPDQGPVEAHEKEAFALLQADSPLVDFRAVQRAAQRLGVMTVLAHATYASSDFYRDLAPYAWSYGPGFDDLAVEAGRFVCSSLAGKPARYAGVQFANRTRKFGVLVQAAETYPIDLAPLRDTLATCGVGPLPVYEIHKSDTDDKVSRLYLNMRADEVTSLLVFTDAELTTRYMNKLPVEFEPEWVLSGIGTHEQEVFWKRTFSTKRRSLFGTFTLNKLHRPEDTPAWWAFQEGPGGAETRPSTEVHPARHPRLHMAYRSLLLLASGIQMAGPRLTPETFQTGLQKARFPNPGAGADPFHQARVGFGPGDFTMVDDVSVVWWSDNAPSYGDPSAGRTGGWCYVDRGARFDRRNWRDVEGKLFDPAPSACR